MPLDLAQVGRGYGDFIRGVFERLCDTIAADDLAKLTSWARRQGGRLRNGVPRYGTNGSRHYRSGMRVPWINSELNAGNRAEIASGLEGKVQRGSAAHHRKYRDCGLVSAKGIRRLGGRPLSFQKSAQRNGPSSGAAEAVPAR
jgi:hypothetical protein